MYNYYDSGMPYDLLWMLSRGYFMIILFYGGFFLYAFPLLQALVQYQNKKWLNFTLSRVKGLAPDTRDKIIAEAEPEFKQPIYKLTKLQYLVSGIVTTIVGILIVAIREPDEGTFKALIWLPLLIGAGITALYYKMFPTVRLWKETAGFFAVLGICITIPGIFAAYEWDWMRSDILVYITLILSLAVVHVLESSIASLLYIGAVAVGSGMLTINVGDNWMYFFKSFIWFFALAPLVYWMPKLKSGKEVGIKEITFGVLFMVMMITVTMTNLGSLRFLGLAIMFPILYMFSKIHFKQQGWFITKPIQTLIVFLTFYGIAAFSFEDVLQSLPTFSYQFIDHFSFSWLVDLIVIAAMVFGAIMMFRDNFEEDMEKINPVVLGFPVVAYILSFTGEYYGNFLFIALMGVFGWSYLQIGLKDKNPFAVLLGALGATTIIPLIFKELPKDTWMEQGTVGMLVTFYGISLIGMALYLRSQWQVTDDDQEDVKLVSTNDDLLDSDMDQ